MEIEVATQQMMEDINSRQHWLACKIAQWVIAEGTRQVGLSEPLKLRMACRILVKRGISLDQIIRRAS